jgi:uncharacterized membrane protein YtjA (UPF0391 family)
MTVLKWIVLCFVVGVVFIIAGIAAGLLGFPGIAGVATNIAWIVFGVGVALALVVFFRGRKAPDR